MEEVAFLNIYLTPKPSLVPTGDTAPALRWEAVQGASESSCPAFHVADEKAALRALGPAPLTQLVSGRAGQGPSPLLRYARYMWERQESP